MDHILVFLALSDVSLSLLLHELSSLMIILLQLVMGTVRRLRLLEAAKLVLKQLEHLLLHLWGQIIGLPMARSDSCEELIYPELL